MIQEITFPCFEFPRVMFGSEGSHFTRQDLQEVSQHVESKTTGLLLHTIPRPNGQAETSHKKIENILQKIVNAMGKGWNSMIPEAL